MLSGDVLSELVALLTLEKLEENLFRGQSQDLGWGTVFGGQVLGQALSAATQTVPEASQVHSLHGYFLRPGDVSRPIVYEVDRIRDGRSFTTRRVVAVQRGRAIFNLAASFHVEESGFDHQDPMPDAPDPDTLISEHELAQAYADHIPAWMRERLLAPRPIELRPIDPVDPVNPSPRPARRMIWYKAAGQLPDQPALHRYLLAYASDFSFITTALMPHGVTLLSHPLQVASIDHAMYFHRPLRFDDWLLHVIDSPSVFGARGLVRGRFFNRQGQLVASSTQEGLIRERRPKAKP